MCLCQILLVSDIEHDMSRMSFVQKENDWAYHTLHPLNLKVDHNPSHKKVNVSFV